MSYFLCYIRVEPNLLIYQNLGVLAGAAMSFITYFVMARFVAESGTGGNYWKLEYVPALVLCLAGAIALAVNLERVGSKSLALIR